MILKDSPFILGSNLTFRSTMNHTFHTNLAVAFPLKLSSRTFLNSHPQPNAVARLGLLIGLLQQANGCMDLQTSGAWSSWPGLRGQAKLIH